MKLTLRRTRVETTDCTTFIFEAAEPINWQAGQFLEYNLAHDHADKRGERRWFTNSAAPHEAVIQITTRFSQPSSTFKTALQAMQPGDTIEAKSPEGDFVLEDPTKQYIFIAGGIGITPFRAILADLHHRGEPLNVTLLYANRTADNVPFKAELESLSQEHPEMDIFYIFNPEQITESRIRDVIRNPEEVTVYVSGPEPMVESLGATVAQIGIGKERIKQDFFPNYPAF